MSQQFQPFQEIDQNRLERARHGNALAPLDKVSKKQERKEYAKNITDGIIQIEKVEEDFDKMDENKDKSMDQEENDVLYDNLGELLAVDPKKEHYFLENLKEQDFRPIQHKQVKWFEKSEKEDQAAIEKGASQDYQYHMLIDDYNKMIYKCTFYFQGFLSGFTLMHVVFLEIQSDFMETLLKAYAVDGTSLYQLFFILQCVSVVGSFHSTYTLWILSKMNSQSQDYQSGFYRLAFCSICYYIAWIFLLLAHRFIAVISDNKTEIVNGTVDYDLYNDDFKWYQVYNIMNAVFVSLGWMMSVNHSKASVESSILQELAQEEEMEEED